MVHVTLLMRTLASSP